MKTSAVGCLAIAIVVVMLFAGVLFGPLGALVVAGLSVPVLLIAILVTLVSRERQERIP